MADSCFWHYPFFLGIKVLSASHKPEEDHAFNCLCVSVCIANSAYMTVGVQHNQLQSHIMGQNTSTRLIVRMTAKITKTGFIHPLLSLLFIIRITANQAC